MYQWFQVHHTCQHSLLFPNLPPGASLERRALPCLGGLADISGTVHSCGQLQCMLYLVMAEELITLNAHCLSLAPGDKR